MPDINNRLNILIAGEGKTLPLVLKSKFLNKLYITSDSEIAGAVNIRFNTFQELAQKCRALKIDIVIAENEKWVLQGISDVLKKNLINCFALPSAGNKLVLSNSFARDLVKKYDILTPKKLAYPNQYPVVVRADGICKIGFSLEEIINIREEISKQSEEIAKTIFLEEFINGQFMHIPSLFDGKNLLSFSNNQFIQEYSKKLCKLLVQEKFNFTGFLTSKLILNDNLVYNLGFSSDFPMPDMKVDFIYLLNSAIYQKLDEISL